VQAKAWAGREDVDFLVTEEEEEDQSRIVVAHGPLPQRKM
jgi:hypothetical protein